MKPKLITAVSAAFIFTLLSYRPVLADGVCVGFYRTNKLGAPTSGQIQISSDRSVQFWPPPENAFMAEGAADIAHRLAQDSVHQQNKARQKVYSAEIIEKSIYTSMLNPEIGKLYLAHQMLLGDLIKTDLYADALVKIMVKDKIDSPEEIEKFVNNFNGWKTLNAAASERFLDLSAKEFAHLLEKFIGDGVSYSSLDEANARYGLSVSDLVQLKSNMALLRQNNDSNLKLSMMLPILADAPNTIKLLNEALIRWKAAHSAVVVPTQTTELALPNPKNSAWNFRFLKNIGKRILGRGQINVDKLPAERHEYLVTGAEAAFSNSRSDFSVDPNFLKNIFLEIKKGREFRFHKVVELIKQSPGYFFLTEKQKNKAGYSSVETSIRISEFIDALSSMKLNGENLNEDAFIDLQSTLDRLKNLIYHTTEVFTEERLSLAAGLTTDALSPDIKSKNANWEKHLIDKINQAKRQLTEFYIDAKNREGASYFSAKEQEYIVATKTNTVFAELFYRSIQNRLIVQPAQLLKLMTDYKLTTTDIMFLLRHFKPDPNATSFSLKGLYEIALLPSFKGDLEANYSLNDLKAVFVGRLAMSFDNSTQRLTLSEFETIFEYLRRSGISETLLGKAALAKFFKSVIGPTPTAYDLYVLELNEVEAYAATVQNVYYDHLLFLRSSFGIIVDPKKASDATSAINKSRGTGTFTILNWIKGAHLQSARGY